MKLVEEYLNEIDYSERGTYVPSTFALQFVNFIKLVEGGDPENKTPVVHYKMLDKFDDGGELDIINLCFRGFAKSTVKEYLILYIGVFGELPKFGRIPYALYVSDSIDNGIKKMRKSLEFRWNNSEFLQQYIPKIRFTDTRWEFINQAGRSFVVSGFGGKSGVRGPLALDSRVYTDTGTKTIEEVQVGDVVFTPQGHSTLVTGKSEVFTGSMYKLTFDDGRELTCDGTHLHPLYVRKVIRVNGVQQTTYEKKLLTTNELMEGKPLISGSRRRYFTQAVEPVQYTNKEFLIAPYLLGLLLGDGNTPTGKSVRLSGIREDVNAYLGNTYWDNLTEVDYLERSGLAMKRVTFKGLHTQIAELGLAGCIDDSKFIPTEYLRGSVQQRRELLAGLLDTDGTCGKEGQVSYSSVSKQLTEGIIDLARSLGYLVRMSVIARDKRKVIYRTYIRGDVNPFKLKRKAEVFKVPERRSKRVALINIECVSDSAPSQCIRVEDDEHEFITDNYLATHNTRENNSRPVLALLDDLISDSDARSPTVIADVEDTIYKAIDYALHPKRRKIIWSGTPFNARDPLYKAVESGAWSVNVYPVCEQFPCSREDFRGAWEDRFNYDFVKKLHDKAVLSGKADSFNQELMLRILSEEDKLIFDGDLRWYDRTTLLKNKHKFNFYITTDFATSEKESADFSIIYVWAYSSGGQVFLVDGVCKRQLMDKNIKDVFRLVQMYKPMGVGVEVTGQQGGFVSWLKTEMLEKNTFFTLTSDSNSSKEGIRPTSDKMTRFMTILPWFKQGLIHLPLECKKDVFVAELVNELSLATGKGFKSKHDDAIDAVTMLSVMQMWKPSSDAVMEQNEDGIWATDVDMMEDSSASISSYIV